MWRVILPVLALVAAGVILVLILLRPTSSTIKTDEEVVFFPTYGYRDGDQWIVHTHGWIYEPETDDTVRRASLGALRRALGLDKDQEDTAIFKQRAGLFLVDNERGKRLTIWLGEKTYELKESGADGHFRTELRLTVQEAKADKDGWLTFEAVMPQGDERKFRGRALLLGESGLSVVSDIDDTVKVTEVRDKSALLANTFLREFQGVDGMAKLYRGWAESGAVFHYVSASPWQLYGPLSEFFAKDGLPPGTFHLKDFRAKDSTFLNLFASPEETKRKAIVPLLEACPRRKFLLVGDSGEKDPEIYGALAREYPKQVVRVIIRDVTEEDASNERYRIAFDKLPPEKWQVVRNPRDVRPLPPEFFK